MPPPNGLRAQQRAQMKPLITALNELFALQHRTRIAIAAESGLTNYQVGRILGESLPAPNYLDVTRLLRAAGLSPNEGAELVGLFEPPVPSTGGGAATPLLAEEARILEMLRTPALRAQQRAFLVQTLETILQGLRGHDLLEKEAQDNNQRAG